MTANDQLVLFAVSTSLVVLVALCLWLNRVMEGRHLRRILTRATAVELLCNENYFDFNKLLRTYRLSPRLKDIQYGDNYFYATIGGKRRIRFTLNYVDGRFILERIECFRGTNWQFADWYEDYLYQFDDETLRYTVVGERDAKEAKRKRRMPSFVLTKKAVEQMVDTCAFG